MGKRRPLIVGPRRQRSDRDVLVVRTQREADELFGAGSFSSIGLPRRIQLRRTKGWRKPEGSIVVARPSKWGNPYRVGTNDHGVFVNVVTAIALYRRWLQKQIAAGALDVGELRGKHLACWCPLPAAGQPDLCHASILLEVANASG